MKKEDAVDIVNEARLAHQLSWAEVASAISKPPVWTVAALHGQHPLSAEDAAKVVEILELSDDVATALQRQPYRAPRADLQSDPTVYRFHEALQVYGSALKELIHEEFGDGIMSAINFRVSLKRQHHPDGDRVVVTFDGKFLPYSGNRDSRIPSGREVPMRYPYLTRLSGAAVFARPWRRLQQADHSMRSPDDASRSFD